MTAEPRLLEGLRVIDAASFIAGSVATTMMADFGADVVKIEPPGGDPYRVRSASYPVMVSLDDPRAGASLTVSSPLQITGQDKVPARMAPEIGEHTVEVLREAGVDAAEIDRLLAADVIVQGKA
jgi:crotonobetainyl-CoA:carnitine CoA-transferase CaiB-like acyl-CoA transferase